MLEMAAGQARFSQEMLGALLLPPLLEHARLGHASLAPTWICLPSRSQVEVYEKAEREQTIVVAQTTAEAEKAEGVSWQSRADKKYH